MNKNRWNYIKRLAPPPPRLVWASTDGYFNGRFRVGKGTYRKQDARKWGWL